MRITIGTGYYADQTNRNDRTAFASLWHKANIEPLDNATVFVIDTAEKGCSPNWRKYGYQVLKMDENPGSYRKMWGYVDPALDAPNLCGWSLSWLTPAFCAYTRGTNFVYIEQDCLCGGPWFESLKQTADKTKHKVLIGKSKTMVCEQSLFWIDRAFIPWFIGRYLQYPGEGQMLCEDKFGFIMARYPQLVGFHGVGPGRDRPIPREGAVSAQKLDEWEVKEIMRPRH